MTDQVVDAQFDGVAMVAQRIEAESDPTRRRMWEVLRQRLIGELLGDFALIESITGPSFHMVTKLSDGEERVADRSEFLTSMKAVCDTGPATWCSWEHLVLDANVIVGTGVLCLVREREGRPTSAQAVPMVVVIEYQSGLMDREVVRLDFGSAREVSLPGLLTRDEIRKALNDPPRATAPPIVR